MRPLTATEAVKLEALKEAERAALTVLHRKEAERDAAYRLWAETEKQLEDFRDSVQLMAGAA